MREHLNTIWRMVYALRNLTGYDDEGRPAPQIVVRAREGGMTAIYMRDMEEPILVPPGQEVAITYRVADAQGQHHLEVYLDRWTRFGTT